MYFHLPGVAATCLHSFKPKLIMKKYIFVFILSFAFISTLPQQTFYTQIYDSNRHQPWDILIKSDGNMLFCSFYRSDDRSWSSIWELDQAGEIINEWTFTNTSEEFLKGTNILQAGNKIYLFGIGENIENGIIKGFISMRKFDEQLNELGNYRYHLNNIKHQSIGPIRVILRGQIFHIFTMVEIEPGWITPGYFKISLSGIKLHSAFLPPSSDQELWPYDMCLMPGSDNLYTVNWDDRVIFNTFGVFTEFDTAMNIVSQFPLGNNSSNPSSLPDFDIMNCENNMLYTMYNEQGMMQRNSVVEKRRIDGSILNRFVYECPEDSASYIAIRCALDTLPDGNLIFCTTKNVDTHIGLQLEPTQIRFFKLTPDLELIWQKFLFGDDGNYRVWNIKAHADGGMVISGTLSPTPPQSWANEIFFMKTDSEGLLTNIGEGEPKIKTNEAILYPNPACEIINIEFSQAYQRATFQLTDIGGKPVFEKQLDSNFQKINISTIPAGTYVYRIFNSEGLDERGKVVIE
jgi:hypothetical protein